MSDLKISLTCADYARVMPLATGAVKPKGIELNMVLGHAGSWPKRAEMLSRAVRDPDVQGGEWSCAQHLYAIDRGDRTHVGLPVFPLRNFTARDIYVRRGGPIRSPADLVGKRVGSYSYTASGSVWYRHFLRHIGVAPEGLRWCIGSPDAPWSAAMDQKLPEGVTQPPDGKSLSDLLIAGEIDAMLSPPRPERYHPVDGPIARLFPDFRPVEEAYFKATGAFPPQHLIVIRRALWEKEPWIARSLTEAFAECEAVFNASIRGFPYATPWMEEDLEKATALMGADFHPVGFEANKAQIAMFAGEAHRMGFTAKHVTPESYFEEFLAG